MRRLFGGEQEKTSGMQIHPTDDNGFQDMVHAELSNTQSIRPSISDRANQIVGIKGLAVTVSNALGPETCKRRAGCWPIVL